MIILGLNQSKSIITLSIIYSFTPRNSYKFTIHLKAMKYKENINKLKEIGASSPNPVKKGLTQASESLTK